MALRAIDHKIPKAILEAAFPPEGRGRLPIPLHTRIRSAVFSRVLEECNIVGGTVKHLPLLNEWRETTTTTRFGYVAGDDRYAIFRIPQDQLEGGQIVAIIGVENMSRFAHNLAADGYRNDTGNSVLMAGEMMLDSYTGGNYVEPPIAELLSGDLVRLSPASMAYEEWVISVRLSYDEDMTNLNAEAILPFCDLVVAATKSYIYNQLIIQLDRVANDGGVELASFRSIVEGYEPSEDEYVALRTEFTGGATMTTERMIKLLCFQ